MYNIFIRLLEKQYVRQMRNTFLGHADIHCDLKRRLVQEEKLFRNGQKFQKGEWYFEAKLQSLANSFYFLFACFFQWRNGTNIRRQGVDGLEGSM